MAEWEQAYVFLQFGGDWGDQCERDQLLEPDGGCLDREDCADVHQGRNQRQLIRHHHSVQGLDGLHHQPTFQVLPHLPGSSLVHRNSQRRRLPRQGKRLHSHLLCSLQWWPRHRLPHRPSQAQCHSHQGQVRPYYLRKCQGSLQGNLYIYYIIYYYIINYLYHHLYSRIIYGIIYLIILMKMAY